VKEGKGGRRFGDGRNKRNFVSHNIFNCISQNLNLTTAINLLAVSVYVLYRTPNPDAATVQLVRNELVEYNINSTQMEDWPLKYCS